ncbi:hypothetical protein KP509_03G063400 [Ceratopteris richardii]|uniref:GPI mannosyltransferase 2 n=1 Tax=Ceratopteris richardii TaxID=49495 RepID=A0A8T2V0K9_CERRI|nr:hypothetical protein KP509_03G063400 [Ceratopteris richardii]
MESRGKASDVREVITFAVLTRVFVFGLMVLWRVLGHPYDTSALLNLPCLDPTSSTYFTPILPELSKMLEKFIVWDAVYYIRIAECGYEYEQTFAFLPVFPLCIRFISRTVFYRLIPYLGYRATLSLAGLILNFNFFIISALFFYKVSDIVLKDKRQAYLSMALFCLNPASIFYASIYSESLFSLLTFAGLLAYLHGARWRASCLFAISGGVRSNGVVHGGFLVFNAIQELLKAFYLRNWKVAVHTLYSAIIQTTIVLGPFVAFQTFGYMKLCWREESHMEGNYARPWCSNRLPYLYGYVQSHYWNVGFLRYFEAKQLPNFLLASPILSLAVASFISYVHHRPRFCLTLGLWIHQPVPERVVDKDEQFESDESRLPGMSSKGTNIKHRLKFIRRISEGARIQEGTKENAFSYVGLITKGGFYSPLNFPILMEMAFMTLVACFIMHVQVATRFLSICPPIYWEDLWVV